MRTAKGAPAGTMALSGGDDVKRAVEEALREWRGTGTGVTVGEERAPDVAHLPTRFAETCLVVRGWTSGGGGASAVFVCGEGEARAAFGIEPDVPLLPFARGFLNLLEERIISTLPPDSQVLFEVEEGVRLTPETIAGAAFTGATSERDVTISVGEGATLAGRVLFGAAGATAPAGDATVLGALAIPDSLGVIMDVELPLVVRLGEAEMMLEELLRLRPGSIIELNRQVNEPAELLVSGKVVAYGEVVVVHENFGVRISRLAHPTGDNIRLVT